MIYALVGPTASGKSSLAIYLALKYKGIIINGDAFQVYKGMDIGTAKPSLEERKLVPHYLYDILDVNQEFSIYEYQKLLRKTLDEHKDELIFIVGGSGLYLKSSLYDFTLSCENKFDMKEYDSYSNEQLYELLKEVDYESSLKIHQNNRRRVLRALEINFSTGLKKSDIEKNQEHKLLYDVSFLSLDINRDLMYERINKRVDEMVSTGLFREVNDLLSKYPSSLKSFQAIGYKQIINGLKENKSEEEIIEEIKKVTRNYAKRQMTYFKHQLPVIWCKTKEEIEEYILKKGI